MPDEIPVKDSILQSTKKLLGLSHDYDAFDLDIITHINSAFSTLYQAGVGPLSGFYITDASDTWDRFIGNKMHINDVKSYVYLKVRLLWDPPANSFGIASSEKMLEEFIWRLNVADDISHVLQSSLTPTPPTDQQGLFWNISNGVGFPEEASVGDWGIDLATGVATQKTE